MGIFSNLAARAWNTVTKIVSLFGKLSDAKRRKLKNDKERIEDLSLKQNRLPQSFPGYEDIEKEEEKINKLKELSENIPR